MTVTVGNYVETIPAGAFQWDAVEENYQYTGVSGGITKFVLKHNATFNCKASGIDLGVTNLDIPIYVALQICDDMGEAEVHFNIK